MTICVLTPAEHPDVQEIHAPCTPTQRTTRPARYDAGPPNYLPPFKFPPQQVRPDHGAVGINELSVGLGLPSLKADTNEDGSPAASQHSRLSQAHPGALYGKLIGWALDKPLTAKGLAGYLQNQNLHTPSNRLEPMTHASSANTVLEDTEAILTPPRSAQTRAPIHVTAEAVNEPQGQSAFQHQHRRSSNSSASYRHHTRNSSTRKFSRRMSRAKRMDQGPMPSSADIYPDDANWTPSAPIYEGQNYLAYHGQPVEQPKVVVDNAFNWPTPAQVYRPELAPTAADIGAADRDVLAIMSESTGLSLNTLAELSTSQDLSVAAGLNLPWDLRALTPAQLDGSRYGMKFYGIAIGDEWDLDLVGDFDQSKPFRVRPREHDGWGGWEWARSRGWGA